MPRQGAVGVTPAVRQGGELHRAVSVPEFVGQTGHRTQLQCGVAQTMRGAVVLIVGFRTERLREAGEAAGFVPLPKSTPKPHAALLWLKPKGWLFGRR